MIYEDIRLSEVAPDNTYTQPIPPLRAKKDFLKEAELELSKGSASTRKFSKSKCYNVFLTAFTAITLVLTLACLALILIQYTLQLLPLNRSHQGSQIQEPELRNSQDWRNLQIAMEALQMQLNRSNQDIQHQAYVLQDFQEIVQTIKQQINDSNWKIMNLMENHAILPRDSCKYLSKERPPAYYHIETDSGIKYVYCDTNRTSCSCNTTGGWMRVANLDMTNPSQNCPDGFKQIERTEPPLRTCGRRDGATGCVSTTFAANGIEYLYVCGRVQAYQFGKPEAFHPYIIDNNNGIDSLYADGVSITHGQSPRQHIWTFAGALNELANEISFKCPCITSTYSYMLPPFVGEDYFCDTAAESSGRNVFPDDPLWDGQGCGDTSTCCEFNNPPWFCKQLPSANYRRY